MNPGGGNPPWGDGRVWSIESFKPHIYSMLTGHLSGRPFQQTPSTPMFTSLAAVNGHLTHQIPMLKTTRSAITKRAVWMSTG